MKTILPKTAQLVIEFDEGVVGSNHITGSTEVLGCYMHVDLIAVDKTFSALDPAMQKWIDAVKGADDGDGEQYQTIKLGRKNFFPILTPAQL